MFIKKLFTLAFIIASTSTLAMEQDQKRICLENPDAIQDELEFSPDENLALWFIQLNAYHANLDLAGVRHQLSQHEETQKLTPEERNTLFDKAAESCHKISNMQRFGSMLIGNMTDELLIQKFSFEQEAKQAHKIKNLFYAFKLLKDFKFPQVHFGPQPYAKQDLRPSLNTILESLIMNEEKEISVCCFHLTIYTVAQALVNQKKQGVLVEVITNQKQNEKNPVLQPIKHLVENDIVVSAPKNQAFETNHHKYFIFKSNVCKKPLVWAGSYNCTGHSNENSWEDVTIFDDAKIVENYRARFSEIKAASQPITQEELNDIVSNPSKTVLEKNMIPKDLWPK